MADPESDLAPPVRLAIAYAPRAARTAFALLLRLDARLASIVGRASEPLIGQMKLAWWRDALLGASGPRPRGESLLGEFENCGKQVPDDALEQLISAWEMLLIAEAWSTDSVEEFTRLRGAAIFNTYADLVGAGQDVSTLGVSWAMNDLKMQFGDRVQVLTSPTSPERPQSRMPRPLTILAMSVRGVTGPRLVWHALTGW